MALNVMERRVELVWMILSKYWKVIAVAVVIGGLLTYTKIVAVERNHYKTKAETVEAKLESLIASSKAEEERLNNENAALTAKYKNTLRDANTLVTVNAKLNEENIKNAKELRDVKLSLNTIRLFNASKQSSSQEEKPATTVSGNDGTATSVAKALEEKSQTLADLMLVVNENDANHLKCIATVTEWQNFWREYERIVNAGNN